MTNDLVPLPVMFTPATAEDYNTMALAIADVLGLRTTSWEQGDPSRTILAVDSNLLMLRDVTISLQAQGGFLDTAADGSVTYVDPVSGSTITVYVTPDPSNPAQNPTGELGMLDVLADSVYDERRVLSSQAGGTLALLNLSASTYGPFDAGGYHVAQATAPGSPTYSNRESLTIAPSASAGAGITDASNLSPIVITDIGHGLVDDDIVFIQGVGGNTAANGAWVVTRVDADHFSLNGSTGNSAYTSGGTAYVPTTAPFTADVAGTASDATTGNLVLTTVTLLIGVSVANVDPWLGSDTQDNDSLAQTCRLRLQALSPNGPRGAYEYFSLKSQILAPTLTPPEAISTAITRVLVEADVTTGTVTVTLANRSGAPSSADVNVVYGVLQAFCVPLGITLIVQAATAHSMAVVINVWVPAAYATTIVAVAQTAVQNYFAMLAIGGVTDPTEGSPNTNIVPYNAVLGTVFRVASGQGIPVQQVTGTVDGGTANVQLLLTPTPEVATLSGTPTVNVIPV